MNSEIRAIKSKINEPKFLWQIPASEYLLDSFGSFESYTIKHTPVTERLAGDVQVSTIRVDMEFERNTPKLNLTLYVPILILLALFLGSILIPSKLFDQNLGNSLTKKDQWNVSRAFKRPSKEKAPKRYELRTEINGSENPEIIIIFKLHPAKSSASKSHFFYHRTFTSMYSKTCCHHLKQPQTLRLLLFSSSF